MTGQHEPLGNHVMTVTLGFNANIFGHHNSPSVKRLPFKNQKEFR